MEEEIKEGKTAALAAYFTIVGSLIAISMNSDPKNAYARFHTRQAFGLHLLFIAFGILSSNWGNLYSFFGLMLSYTILWFYGFLGPWRVSINPYRFWVLTFKNGSHSFPNN